MATRPLLILPHPERAERMPRGGGPSKIHFPSHAQQVRRLSPKFRELAQALDAERARLQQAPGLEPERVLVIETVDGVDDFVKAVRKTPGMEWLAEWEEESIEPDEQFYRTSDTDSSLRGRLYLIMSNLEAMNQLHRLWNIYRRDPKEQFSLGLNKWRNIFARIRDLRFWDERDRVDQNLIRFWQQQIAGQKRTITFKTELWFSNNDQRRITNQRVVEDAIRELGGRILAQATVPEIAFQALAGELPAQAANRLINLEPLRLLRCNEVMFFRPLGQSATLLPLGEPAGPVRGENRDLPVHENPIVALLDGLPISNHQLLAGRLIVDDPDEWSEEYPVDQRVHGTMMASIIANGDLSANEASIRTPIYVRPILRPDRAGWRDPVEAVPENVLLEDLVQRAILRMLSNENGEDPIAPSVRVVTLAIGDPLVMFDRAMSPLARMLDWLAWKQKILFLVSAGNQTQHIELGINRGTLQDLTPVQLQVETIRAIENSGLNRRLLCPAESINALTIGALHSDDSTIDNIGNRVNPLQSPQLPSPINSVGL